MTEQQIRKRVMDSREPGSIRMKLYEVGWTQENLLTGDYWFFTHDFKKVGIERKAVGDLLNSIGDRLSRQLETLLEHYDKCILLIEGSWRKVSPSEKIVSRGIEYYTWSMVWNYLRRFQDKGVTLELTVDEGHTVQRLNELYALYQKPYSTSGGSKDFTDDRILAFPSGCRGKTAMDCLACFGSILDVAVCSPAELMKVNNIAEKKALMIFNHFNKGTRVESLPPEVRDKAGEQAKLI